LAGGLRATPGVMARHPADTTKVVHTGAPTASYIQDDGGSEGSHPCRQRGDRRAKGAAGDRGDLSGNAWRSRNVSDDGAARAILGHRGRDHPTPAAVTHDGRGRLLQSRTNYRRIAWPGLAVGPPGTIWAMNTAQDDRRFAVIPWDEELAGPVGHDGSRAAWTLARTSTRSTSANEASSLQWFARMRAQDASPHGGLSHLWFSELPPSSGEIRRRSPRRASSPGAPRSGGSRSSDHASGGDPLGPHLANRS